MKTFEQEYEELWGWFREKTKDISDMAKKEPLRLDGSSDYAQKEITHEYNQRLLALKSKYGRK